MAILKMFTKEDEEKKSKKKAVVKAVKQIKPVEKKETAIKSEAKNKKDDEKSSIGAFIKLVTEKTTDLAEKGAYSFKVASNLNKIMVKNEIKRLYGMTPLKINIINSPDKKISYRGRQSKKSGFKKAVIYLREGDKLPE